MGETMRVVDFGEVSPLRSQTLWHALAHGVSRGSPPTLAFCRPTHPYVSIGYHRRLQEVDQQWCRSHSLPIFRRMVGGGPVYLDCDQQFFQVVIPARMAAPTRVRALRALLAPVAEAFAAVGIDARLDEQIELVVGDRKVCGHAAGQIEEAVVLVGNLITAFDHARAARILAAPHPEAAAEYARLVDRYVAATPAEPALFREAVARAYAATLGLEPQPGEMTGFERSRLDELDRRFVTREWLEGPPVVSAPGWRAKVKAGVFVYSHQKDATRLILTVVEGHIGFARLVDPALNGAAPALEAALVGLTPKAAREALDQGGEGGQRLAELVASLRTDEGGN